MKKNIYTYVFGYFSNSMCEKKKCIYVFFGDFPAVEKKKKFCSRSAETVLGHCPNCIVIESFVL